MIINDKSGLVQHLKELIKLDEKIEHCVIGVADVVYINGIYEFNIIDHCKTMEFGGTTDIFEVTIPKNVIGALVSICKKQDMIPIIAHSHVSAHSSVTGYTFAEELQFSPQDMNYIHKFVSYLNSNSKCNFCIFVLAKEQKILYCIIDIKQNQYMYLEE